MAHLNKFEIFIPGAKYSFSWKVENFHLSSLNVRGDEFSPIPGFAEKFCFELRFGKYRYRSDGQLMTKLLYLNDQKKDMIVSGNISISHKDKTLFSQIVNATPISQLHSLMVADYLPVPAGGRVPESLAVDVLIVSGTLTFSNYRVISSNTSQPSSEICSCKELASDIKTKYENSLSSGIITFSIDKKKLAAHKEILCINSPVFEKMFQHNVLENNTKEVIITDIDFRTFNAFLAFLYTGIVKYDSYESLVSLYPVAKKYQVKSLQKKCLPLLSSELSVEYVCEALMLADLHEDRELKEMAQICAWENFLDLAGTEKWAELVTAYPKLAREVLDYMKPNSK